MHDELDLNLDPSEPSVPGMDQGGASLPQGEVDHEGAMAKADLYKLANYSLKLFKKIQDGDQLDGWVQAKITKAADYIASVYHYLEYEMEFSEYGKKLDNSDVLSESQKAVLKNRLMEAKAAIKELKKAQVEKQFGLDEGILSGGEQTCGECGGSGIVHMPARAVPEATKEKVRKYNRQAKAFHAASKRIDANKNGIPDDEEFDETSGDEPAAPNADLIAKRKAREAAQRRREEKGDADQDDLSKDVKPKAAKSSGTKKVAGKAYGGSAQKDDSDVEESQGSVYGKGVYEGKSKKAKKDYDKDGKIESEKDEVIGSRRKAAGLDEAKEEKRAPAKKTERETTLPSGAKAKTTKVQGWQSQKAEKDAEKEQGLDEAKEEKRAPAKKTSHETTLPSGAKVKTTKVQGWQSQKADKAAEKEQGFDEGQGAPLSPEQAAAVAKSSDPNAYNKAKGIATPKTTTPVVSPDEGPTKNAKPAPTVVKESAELNRMKEFLTRLNG